MKRTFLALAALAASLHVGAQRIDINNTTNWAEDRLTETGYTAWPIGTVSQASTTVDGVTVTATVEGSPADRTLKGNWWKDGVQKYSKLVSDGLAVYGFDGSNTPQVQQGEVGISLTLSGLSAGEHTLLAYHNNTDGYDSPPIDILIDGTIVESGVAQTNRAQTPSASGMSYIRFTATADQAVTIVYRTHPDPDTDYTQGYRTTSLFINALVLDRPNPKTTASDPWPENTDMHADADGGSCTLTWTAASVATKHHVYLGTSPDQLEPVGTPTRPRLSQTGLSTACTYYWRVDEEAADGTIYQGDIWSFRPRRLAFPGAEGYGRYAIGGRGGTVYHVTSLDDDVSNPQPGTLRYGITQLSGPRTIVFDVAGTITLKGRLTCSTPYVTVAGQTAPGRGIMMRGAPFGMASDGITRFLRMRLGYHNGDTNKGLDGMGMAGNDHAIMDHCSISWTVDEGFSSRGAKNITLQRTLISEALNIADHPNYAQGKGHGYAATIGGGENGGLGSSFHHNLLAHNEGRNWSMSGGLDGKGAYDGHHDMFNNVCYNWGSRATDGGTHEGQFVGNYYKMGPATTKTVLLQADLEGTGTGTQAYYVSGNIRENRNGQKTTDKENDTYNYRLTGGQKLDWTVFQQEPFFPSYATVETAEAAYKNVLSDVGCNQPELDNHDQRMVSETLNGTTSTIGSKSGMKGLIDRETDAEGFQGLNIIEATRPDGWDTDQDGIPDWFEQAAGTDPQAPNNNADRDDDGYTDLEEYLNWLADPHFVTDAEGYATIDLRPYFAGYRDPTITLPPDVDNGTSWTLLPDLRLLVWCGLPTLLSVEVTAEEDGISLTRRFNFCRTDHPTRLQAPIASPRPAPSVFNLQGQRLSRPQKGINIIDGKKYIIINQ